MAYRNEWNELRRGIRKLMRYVSNSGELKKMEQSIRKAVDELLNKGAQSGASGRVVDAQPVKQNTKLLYGSTAGKSVKSFFKTLIGVPLSFSMGVGMAGSIGTFDPAGWAAMAVFLAAGLWMSITGFSTFGRIKRFKVYKRILGNSTHARVEELAHSVGKTAPFIRRDVRRLILDGFFRQGHLDREEQTLITSDETYRHYEQSRIAMEERRRLEAEEQARRQQEQKQKDEEQAQPKEEPEGNPQLRELLNRGNAFIARIHASNDAIPGEEISGKIDRMENIIRRIFQRAEQHPEVIPDLKKMMDYYLPMTVKLLDAYADMDMEPHQGENILSSKREIEATLDTLNGAYEKLLDSLYEDTALDVSSDISVLKTLLAQEGLTGDDFPDLQTDKSI